MTESIVTITGSIEKSLRESLLPFKNLSMNAYKKIGLGGGCHWCTEAVFASLIGVQQVEQGWIASDAPYEAYSEAVIVTYNTQQITLKDLIEIHLHTHASTSNHSMRHKYRSAVYWLDEDDKEMAAGALVQLQENFDQQLITTVLPYVSFKENIPEQLNYYYTNPEKPFCQVYITPKLQIIKKRFSGLARFDKEQQHLP